MEKGEDGDVWKSGVVKRAKEERDARSVQVSSSQQTVTHPPENLLVCREEERRRGTHRFLRLGSTVDGVGHVELVGVELRV
jgi:hypothetical protein